MMPTDYPTMRARIRMIVCATALACATIITAAPQGLPDEAHLQRLRDYIKNSWTTLSRSN